MEQLNPPISYWWECKLVQTYSQVTPMKMRVLRQKKTPSGRNKNKVSHGWGGEYQVFLTLEST